MTPRWRLRSGLAATAMVSLIAGGATSQVIRGPHRAPPPKRSEQQVRRDLDGFLLKGRSNEIGQGELVTRAHASEVAGVCQRDMIRIDYAPVDVDNRDGPDRPAGLRVRPWFHIVGPLTTKDPRGRWDAFPEACTALDREPDAVWVDAYTAFDVAAAGMMVRTVLDEVRAGRLKVDCLSPGSASAECPQDARRTTTVARIDYVGSCQAPVGQLCLGVNFSNGLSMTLRANRQPGAPGWPTGVPVVTVDPAGTEVRT